MGRPLTLTEGPLYERDFYAWTQDQAAKLRGRTHNDIDWDNTAEEVESLGRSDKREIENRLATLTGMDATEFPSDCPYKVEDVLDDRFLPGSPMAKEDLDRN